MYIHLFYSFLPKNIICTTFYFLQIQYFSYRHKAWSFYFWKIKLKKCVYRHFKSAIDATNVSCIKNSRSTSSHMSVCAILWACRSAIFINRESDIIIVRRFQTICDTNKPFYTRRQSMGATLQLCGRDIWEFSKRIVINLMLSTGGYCLGKLLAPRRQTNSAAGRYEPLRDRQTAAGRPFYGESTLVACVDLFSAST